MQKVIKYDNKMNTVNFSKFTSNDFNFFFAICYKMQEKRSEKVMITFDEVRKLINYKETDINRFIRDIDRMYGKMESVRYRYEDTGQIDRFTFFNDFHLDKLEQTIIIGVHPRFQDWLNDLKQQFTFFELRHFVNLHSKYSKTLFRICKQWQVIGETPIYEIEQIKHLFDCPKYDSRNLVRIIIKAVEELNTSQIINGLTYELIRESNKRGRPLKGVKFMFDKQLRLEVKPPKTQKSKKPKFNDFQNNNYDFDELEAMLLESE